MDSDVEDDDGSFANQFNGGENLDNGGIENHLKKRRLDGANTPINLILPPFGFRSNR